MKRRVVKHGPSTFIISLPSKWVKHFDIKRGDELDVEEEYNVLTVTVNRRKQERVTEVDVSHLRSFHIAKIIRSIYVSGADSLLLTFSNEATPDEKDVLSVIHETTGSLIGYEVVEDNKNSCLIKDLQETSIKDFDQLMKRIFTLIVNMTDYFAQKSKSEDLPTISLVQDRYMTVMKFARYCLRLLNRRELKLPLKKNYYFYVISRLMCVAHFLKDAACMVSSMEKRKYENAPLFLQKLSDATKAYEEMFFTYDIHKAEFITQQREELLHMIRLRAKEIPGDDMMVIANLLMVMNVLEELVNARISLEY